MLGEGQTLTEVIIVKTPERDKDMSYVVDGGRTFQTEVAGTASIKSLEVRVWLWNLDRAKVQINLKKNDVRR